VNTIAGITPLILTYNEEANIGRVLEKLAWAEEILVIDSLSSDRTPEILATWPKVKVVERPFDNHVNQWNFGLSQVRTPWVLSLDADYVLSDELVRELQVKAPVLDKAGYFAGFTYCIHGRPLRASLYPPRTVLFRKDRAHYVADAHTQLLHLDGEAGRLKATIYHDDRKPLNAWLHAQERYGSLEVRTIIDTPHRALTLLDRMRRLGWLSPIVAALYCLFGKRLILDGKIGLYYTLQRVYTELLLSLRLLDDRLSRGSSHPIGASDMNVPSETGVGRASRDQKAAMLRDV
jgi:glycosyltransferase involved in cell wall biosynthesis